MWQCHTIQYGVQIDVVTWGIRIVCFSVKQTRTTSKGGQQGPPASIEADFPQYCVVLGAKVHSSLHMIAVHCR
jgi:hypothetical protein